MDELIPYIRHKEGCDFTEPMWHKGPCDCGLQEILEKLPPEIRTKLKHLEPNEKS